MAESSDDDKILSFDLHLAACLHAVEDLTEALSNLYVSVWLLASGNDVEANKLYRRTYHELLRAIADEVRSLEVTDEIRTQYQEQINGKN